MRRAWLSWIGVRPILGLCLALVVGPEARAQQVDMTRGGPVEITASDGLEWHQNEQQVVARGNARAVRGNVTVTADRLVAYYRKKRPGPNTVPSPPPAPGHAAQPAGQPAAQQGLLGGTDAGSNEIYRVEAIGNVHIYTQTDQVWGARAVYDMDQAVLLMTGGNLKLTTPTQVLTARDSLEYWTDKRMAVARGNAVVVTNDAKRVAADTLVAFTKDDNTAKGQASGGHGGAQGRHQGQAAENPDGKPGAQQPPGSGKLQRVEAFGHVSIQTPTELVTGDRGIYVADTGLARLGGNVRITRGENQLNGSDALVDMNTGISRLLAGTTGRVIGLVVPNDPSNQTQTGGVTPGSAAPPKPAGTAAPARHGRHNAAPQPVATQPTGTQP